MERRDRPRILCWGEVLWDCFPDEHRLGGAPSNVAFHLAQIGASVQLISRVGDDETGLRAVAQLQAAGVDTRAVQVDVQHPTGAVDVTVHGGEPSYSLRRDSAWEFIELTAAGRELLAAADAVCFGTLSHKRPEARAHFDQLLAMRPDHCISVCDINLRVSEQDGELVQWALARADWLKINEREQQQIAALTGVEPTFESLWDRGVAEIALTRGSDGCKLASRDLQIDQAGFPTQAGGDNIGCGDAFTAVWAYRRLCGQPMEVAAGDACRYAAWVAGHPGATPVADDRAPIPWLR